MMFTAAEVADMRAEEVNGMEHTYTRTSLVDTNGVDAWYDEVYTAGADVTGQRCVFKVAGDMSPGNVAGSTEYPESGDLRTLNRVTLVVPITDPISDGDTVKHVVYVPTGEVVSEGPYHVERVNIIGGDMPTIKVAVLHG